VEKAVYSLCNQRDRSKRGQEEIPVQIKERKLK
jgi:hypothetical protein